MNTVRVKFLCLLMVCVSACQPRSDGNWIVGLEMSPSRLRIHQGEAARITFTVRDRRAAAAGFSRAVHPELRSVEVAVTRVGRIGGARRSFAWSNPSPGQKVAIWDGTLEGERHRPPASGWYRVRVQTADDAGWTQQVSRRFRIVNDSRKPVLPRTRSGLMLRSLEFNGTRATLTDEAGNTISVRAASGLKADHPGNPTGIDYTHPRHQWVTDRGPIPGGVYFVLRDQVQFPDFRGGELRYATAGTFEQWGPMRVMLHPAVVGPRFAFFLHLDPRADGTAGCIGVHPADEGRFNQMMSLIAWMPNDSLRVIVNYDRQR